MTDPIVAPRTPLAATASPAPAPSRADRSRRAARALLLLACLLAWTAAPARGVVTDDLGREVALDAPPERVVSMIPTHTETVCALGACDLLVGVDTFSNHPGEVERLPDLGSAFSPDLEALLQLEPQLVLTDAYSGLEEVLAPLGVDVYVAMPERVEDVWEITDEIGTLLGREEAAAGLIEEMRAQLDTATDRAAALPPVSVYVEIDATPYSVGPASYLGSLVRMAGGDNIVPEGMGDFPQLDPETIIEADPEVILLSDAPYGESAETLAQRPGWAGMRALREGRVVELTQDQVDLLNRAGPRLPEALDLLIDLLHPDAP